MNLKFIYNLMKNNKRGKTFMLCYLLAFVIAKVVFLSTLTLVETSFKNRIYKKYLRFRLKNINN